jgi:hypothetical protein
MTLILALAAAATAAALAQAGHSLAEEIGVRRDVLCARYGALAGLALGPGHVDAAALLDASVSSLTVSAVLRTQAWCVYRSTASCGRARRVLERTVALERCST